MNFSVIKNKLKSKAVLAIALSLLLIFSIVGYDLVVSRSEYSSAGVAMGTVINVKLYGSDGKVTSDLIMNEIDATENSLLSWRAKSSDVARINADAGKTVSVSQDVADIIASCVDFSGDSNGLFDITLGKITQLWDFGGKKQRVPSENEITPLLEDVDSSEILVVGHNVTIGDNQSLDLGAVGKGAACDRVRQVLENTSTDSAVVSVGGSLIIYGNRKHSIGVANPLDNAKSMGTLKLKDTCVSTSGTYEKYFEADDKTYHHILDATTGYPADSIISSVTVVCSSGMESDALSTVCFLLGYKDSLEILEKYEAEAIFIYNDNTVRVTDGLRDKFEITDESFVMSE